MGILGRPGLVGNNTMSTLSDIEEGKEEGLSRGSTAGTAAADGGGGSISGEGTRSISTESFEGGVELLGEVDGRGEAHVGRGSSSRLHREQSVSHAAIVEAGDGEEAARSRNGEGRRAVGVTWQTGRKENPLRSPGGSWRGVPVISLNIVARQLQDVEYM